MMRILLACLLLSCSSGAADVEACDGSIPAACDGRCVWRCIDNRWQAKTCIPCVCIEDVCAWVDP